MTRSLIRGLPAYPRRFSSFIDRWEQRLVSVRKSYSIIYSRKTWVTGTQTRTQGHQSIRSSEPNSLLHIELSKEVIRIGPFCPKETFPTSHPLAWRRIDEPPGEPFLNKDHQWWRLPYKELGGRSHPWIPGTWQQGKRLIGSTSDHHLGYHDCRCFNTA